MREEADGMLTSLLMKGGSDRVSYEVSDSGRTLTTRTSGSLGDQVIVFRRRP
jgi:hypothetical protein